MCMCVCISIYTHRFNIALTLPLKCSKNNIVKQWLISLCFISGLIYFAVWMFDG